MSRPLSLALLALLGIAVATGPAEARRSRRFGGKQYTANGTFGLGLELGAPFGLNGKYFLNPRGALDFGVGDNGRAYHDRDGLHIYVDYLWHPVSLANTPAFQLPLYIGIGGRIWDFDDHHRDDDGLAFGLRVPVGIDLDLNNVPLDFFFQVTFVADFYRRYYHDYGADLDASVGIRFWFN